MFLFYKMELKNIKADEKKKIVEYFLEQGILVNKELLDKLSEEDVKKICSFGSVTKETILDKDTLDNFKKGDKGPRSEVKVVFSYQEEAKKRSIQDFVGFFNRRYESLKNILYNRQELENITSISRIKKKTEREQVSVIAMVTEKHTTKNQNIILTLEDNTGSIKALVNKNKPDLYREAKNIVLDEVIGAVGSNSDNIVFLNNILWPDIPLGKELKKNPTKEYALFLSDFHVGSDHFLGEQFNKFLQWINCETGSEEQKEVARNVKYIFIVGDLIDGVGIYPGQDKELVIKDVYEQYKECANLLKKIPCHIKLIICAGNHDAMRIAEPQPELYRDFAEPIYELPNIIMVSNPGIVNMGATKDFPGFDVLLYHGYSFDYYVANVDSIRNQGGYDRADLIMKFLLKRRHLAPTYTSTLYIPDAKKDHLVITNIPDFFITGHIHKTSVSNYRNITLVCGSCWQSKTPFQEKVGHHPEPCRVPIVDLQTRVVKILKF